MSFPPWDNGQQFQSCMILGVPSVRQWERVKVINKLLHCLECLSIVWVLWCPCSWCACNDAGVSVSERCLKAVRIVGWRVLCSQITASDKAREKHWLYRYLSSAPYLRCVCVCVCDVPLSSRGLSQRRVYPPRHTAVVHIWKPRPDWSTGRQRLMLKPGRRLSLAANPRIGRWGVGNVSRENKRPHDSARAKCATFPSSCSALLFWWVGVGWSHPVLIFREVS